MAKQKLRWRNRRGDSYHFYTDGKYDYAYVVRRFGTRVHYDATCPGSNKSKECSKLREAKRFVERNWKR